MWKVRPFHPNALLYKYSHTAAMPELGCLLSDVLYHVDFSVSGYAIQSTNSAAKIHRKCVYRILLPQETTGK